MGFAMPQVRFSLAVAALRKSFAAETTSRREFVTGILLCIGLALLPFGDIQPLRAVGGGYLASPAGLLIAAAWVIWGPKPRRSLFGFLGALVAVSCLLSASLLLDSGQTYFLDEIPAVKDIKMAIDLATEVAVFYAGFELSKRFPTSFSIGFSIALSLSVVMAVVTLMGWKVFDEGNFFHSWVNVQGRVRAAQGEASYFAASLILICGALALLARTSRVRIIMLALAVVTPAVLTASRGAFVGLAVALMVFAVIWMTRRFVRPNWLIFWAALLATGTAVMAFLLPAVTASQLWRSVGLADTQYTSDATRAAWAFAVLLAVIASPIGLGLASSVIQSQNFLIQAQVFLSGAFSEKQWAEVDNLIRTGSDLQLAPKSLVTVFTLILGVLGFAAIVLVYTRIYLAQEILVTSSVDSNLLKIFALWVMVFAAVSYGSITSWDLVLVLGILSSKPRATQCVS